MQVEDCWLSCLPGCGPKPVRTSRQGRRRLCREPRSACVAPSVPLSPPSLSWSTCVIVKTASAGQGCHGVAPRTFRLKPSASMVRTGFMRGRATPAPVSITISAQPAASPFAGSGRRAARDLEFRSGCSTIRHSPPRRSLFGKKDDTRGRLPWTTWRIGTRNRLPLLLAKALLAGPTLNDQPMRSSVAFE
jgi:hypothetical protein